MIPGDTIDNRAAHSKEEDPESLPSGFTVLVKHKPLLILALALAAFPSRQRGDLPLYGLAAVADGQANGPTFVATTIVVAQAVMIVTSIVGMRAAKSRRFFLPRSSHCLCAEAERRSTNPWNRKFNWIDGLMCQHANREEVRYGMTSHRLRSSSCSRLAGTPPEPARSVRGQNPFGPGS